MPRKIIIDCDPGIDDALALTVALFEPKLEVVAVTAVGGVVPADRATLNVQAIVERLDPPRYPRLGAASVAEDVPYTDGRLLHGADGLGGAGFQVSKLARQHPAEKLISDEIRAAPGDVTILCLGPLTNVARALAREPDLVDMVSRIVIRGGSVKAIGDVTACAESNIYADPVSARAVFRSPITKTLIPLDVTDQVVWGLDLLEQLPPDFSRAGKLLRATLPFFFRSQRQHLGLESARLPEAVGLCAVLHPELFRMEELSGDVEISGEITTGMTVFDRRPNAPHHGGMEVALEVDAAAVADCLVRGIAEAGART
ncbi:MAG TPA: nucleoside hydrolase [Pirellulaceae bacterium]|jgi:inosine-uridine nucleoside N-ribohydrolase